MNAGMQRNRSNLMDVSGKLVGVWLMVGGFVFSAACFLKAMPSSSVNAEAVNESASHQASPISSSRLGYRTKRIENIRVGDRVLADNPDVDSPSETAVNPQAWRKLRLFAESRWDDGTVDDINVDTLQPIEWITAVDARVGSFVPIPADLVDMGLPEELQAQVISIDPCPPINPGAGRVILTTVDHLNPYVLELKVQSAAGATESIRPTGFHKFYRSSDGAWVSAETLRPGDTLQGIRGPIRVVSLERIPGIHRVYNFTVEGEHAYNVSKLGILVHNIDCKAWAKLFADSKGGKITTVVPNTTNVPGATMLPGKPPGHPSGGLPWASHDVVIKDGKIFDTGNPNGIDKDEWIKLWADKAGLTPEELAGSIILE